VTAAAGVRSRLDPWALVALLLPAIAILFSRMQVGDLAYLIRTGDLQWASGEILRTDPFTFTVFGSDWMNQQWGAALVFSAIHRGFGLRGLLLGQTLIVGAVYAATFRRARNAGASSLVGAALTLGGFLAAAVLPGALALRPQLLALPLFVVAAWLIDGRDERPRRLLWLVPLSVVWANVHGSFVLLTLLLGIAFVGDLVTRSRSRVLTGALTAASLVIPLANPWGVGIYRYIAELSTTPVIRDVIDEWQPLYRRMPGGLVFLALAAAAAVVVRRHGARPDLERTLGLVAFTALAIWSSRNVLWWSVYVPPVLGGLLAGWAPGTAWSRRATTALGGLLAFLLVVGVVRVAVSSTTHLLSDAPPGITETLTGLPPDARVFATRWGSWFEYAVPALPAFVDARAELFPDDVWDDYFRVVSVSGDWEEPLDRWNIDHVVADRRDSLDLATALHERGWTVVFEDADGIVLSRPGTGEPGS
jgi:hypothetical protein